MDKEGSMGAQVVLLLLGMELENSGILIFIIYGTRHSIPEARYYKRLRNSDLGFSWVVGGSTLYMHGSRHQ